MPFYTDQLNRTIEIPYPPKRIISLVPSQTELLFDLGLEEEVIGITKFCVHPQKWFRQKERIGGTKNINLNKIASLRPDLIIANKEENVREQVKELGTAFPVWVSDVNNLEAACRMIEDIGRITGKAKKSHSIVTGIKNGFNQLRPLHTKPGTAYLIWKDPYMTVGGDTFIHQMLEKAGFQNLFANMTRYPEVTIEQLQAANCQVLLLSSEPYPFKEKHIQQLQEQLPATKICLVDGEMFSWYGSRLLQAPPYFQSLQNGMEAML